MEEYFGSITVIETDKTTPLRGVSAFQFILKAGFIIGAGTLFALIVYGIGYFFDLSWLVYTAYGLELLFIAMGVMVAARAKVGDCPYCGATVGGGATKALNTDGKKQERTECSNCHEWLFSMNKKGFIRPFTAQDAKGRSHFDAPVFKKSVWPNECIICGHKATHFERANTTKFNAEQLLVGSLSVSSASISNIPFCEKHGDEVSIKIKDDHPRVIFPNFGPLKRYIHVNKDNKRRL
ncbi:MAG: hypothetical protein QNK23_00615 [Crocinitomicaceae bacterium]|nr:hypothetical protein [Crocinitomicaceae bacterium]